MKIIQAILCLSGAVLVAARSLTEVDTALALLETLVKTQSDKLAAQETELVSLRAANTSLDPSIFGSGNPGHRAYTFEENVTGALDHMWLILCGALVMFMQAGFAMVEAGCCRAKNVQNILLKNITDVAMGTLGWWMFGWAFAYGGPMVDGYLSNKFMGHEQWAGSGFLAYVPDNGLEPTTSMLAWFFQWAFCSAAATIVSGGVAERVNFGGYVVFSFLMTSWVYPIVVAWTWGYGFMASMNDVGYMDFAGSGIVHMTGGIGALVGAAVAGPRAGRFENPDLFAPHSLPLIVLGTFILWFGWYGFNCGSTLGMSSIATGMMAAQVAMNTTIAAATGGMVVFCIRFARLKKYDIGGFCNGILAGLVSITAPCGNVECGSAFTIAILGGFLFEGTSLLLQKIHVDDPIDAFAVHGACGAWGTLAASLFDWGKDFDAYSGWSGFACVKADGKCQTNAAGQGIAANFAEIFAIAAWVAAWSAMIFLPLRLAGLLVASEEVQETGMDESKHSPAKAYHLDGQRDNAVSAAMTKVVPTVIS